jgi:hypothetical protein
VSLVNKFAQNSGTVKKNWRSTVSTIKKLAQYSDHGKKKILAQYSKHDKKKLAQYSEHGKKLAQNSEH